MSLKGYESKLASMVNRIWIALLWRQRGQNQVGGFIHNGVQALGVNVSLYIFKYSLIPSKFPLDAILCNKK